MKKIVWILMVVMALITTKAEASDSRKHDSDSRCGNRKSFVRSDQLTIIALTPGAPQCTGPLTRK